MLLCIVKAHTLSQGKVSPSGPAPLIWVLCLNHHRHRLSRFWPAPCSMCTIAHVPAFSVSYILRGPVMAPNFKLSAPVFILTTICWTSNHQQSFKKFNNSINNKTQLCRRSILITMCPSFVDLLKIKQFSSFVNFSYSLKLKHSGSNACLSILTILTPSAKPLTP